MTEDTTDTEPPDEQHREPGRYAALTLEDELVIYDRSEESAWIRSDSPVDVADREDATA